MSSRTAGLAALAEHHAELARGDLGPVLAAEPAGQVDALPRHLKGVAQRPKSPVAGRLTCLAPGDDILSLKEETDPAWTWGMSYA